jgi:hypothetical protein
MDVVRYAVRGGAPLPVEQKGALPRGTGSSGDFETRMSVALADDIAGVRVLHPDVKGLYALWENGIVQIWACAENGKPVGGPLLMVNVYERLRVFA